MEPLLPGDQRLGELAECAHDLTRSADQLTGKCQPGVLDGLRGLLRAMNSYYSNRIEGQHTLPVEIEQALRNDYSQVRRGEMQLLAAAASHHLMKSRCCQFSGDVNAQTTRPRTRPAVPRANRPVQRHTDVPGVLVGYATLDGQSADGKTIKTGVTAVLPRGYHPEPQPVWAGIHRFNGNGEMAGTHWIEDAGYFFGPVCITNTHSVGIVHHAAVRWTIQHYASVWPGKHFWAMPVVAETYDGRHNDIDGQHVTEANALAALNSASAGPVTEGNVGGGNGMRSYQFKGGTGTSSRAVAIDGRAYTVAALVQSNHGVRDTFTVLGVPVGKHLPLGSATAQELGSIIIILATDAPMLPHQLQRLARRAAIGFGRNGTFGGNSSGDIFLAFSTANAKPLPQFSPSHLSLEHINDGACDALYLGAVQCTEEAVINAMLAAEDAPEIGPDAGICKALDHGELEQVMAHYGRMGAAQTPDRIARCDTPLQLRPEPTRRPLARWCPTCRVAFRRVTAWTRPWTMRRKPLTCGWK